MSVIIFVGPTISHDEVRARIDCTCLPPAAQGDIYRATRSGPSVIGVIDGYFHGVPSPWHKGFLWAMRQGIHLFGCSSMGALRAAELCDFGMRGVGRIFGDYHDGVLTDDDEVALLHGPAETGFVGLSEPMVNMRATLRQAVLDVVIDESFSQSLAALAKDIFYQKRTWEMLRASAQARGLADGRLDALFKWLPGGRVDVKRLDAIEMLEEINTFGAARSFTHYTCQEEPSEGYLNRMYQVGFRDVDGYPVDVDPPEDCRYWNKKKIFAPIIIK